MEAFGMQLLAVRPAAQSATGEALDAAKETSQLAAAADALQDALEQAMIWVAAYAGEPAAPTVTVNKDFTIGSLSVQELSVLLTAVNTGNISRETFLRELARRGVVPSDIDPEEEADRIAEQSPGMTGQPLPL
jgi:hypothetical protein